MKGRKYSQEHKDNIGKAKKGVCYSKEVKEKQSISQKAVDRTGNKNVSKRMDVRAKISIAKIGVHKSEETKQKLSNIVKEHHKKYGHPSVGLHHSEEAKKRMSDARKKILDIKKNSVVKG